MHLPENFACNTLLHQGNLTMPPAPSPLQLSKDERPPQYLTSYKGREGLRNAKLFWPKKVLLFFKVSLSWFQISKLSSKP